MRSLFVAVIDDDEALCSSLADLMRSIGHRAEPFDSAEMFLNSADRLRFDCIIADLPRGLDGMARRLLARADQIGIVTDLTLAAMRDTQRLAALIEILRPGAKPLVIVNRAGALPRGEIGRAEFEKGIGRKIDAVVPYDVKAASAMHEHGKALPAAARGGKAAIELRRIEAIMVGETKESPRSFVQRLFG